MKIGGTYRIRDIRRRHWEKLATSTGVDKDGLLLRMTAMATDLPDRAADIAAAMRTQGLTHPMVARLADEVSTRARSCVTRLAE